jgi:hypothetical protein
MKTGDGQAVPQQRAGEVIVRRREPLSLAGARVLDRQVLALDSAGFPQPGETGR